MEFVRTALWRSRSELNAAVYDWTRSEWVLPTEWPTKPPTTTDIGPVAAHHAISAHVFRLAGSQTELLSYDGHSSWTLFKAPSLSGCKSLDDHAGRAGRARWSLGCWPVGQYLTPPDMRRSFSHLRLRRVVDPTGTVSQRRRRTTAYWNRVPICQFACFRDDAFRRHAPVPRVTSLTNLQTLFGRSCSITSRVSN